MPNCRAMTMLRSSPATAAMAKKAMTMAVLRKM